MSEDEDFRFQDKGSGENSILGLPWPENYKDLLPLIQNRWGVEGHLYLTRKLSGGKSGALVYAADIESKDFTGQAILKLDEVPNPSRREKHEADRHNLAISDAPDFAAEHLPRLLHTLHHEKKLAVLSTVAGRGLQYALPWNDCVFEKQMQTACEVSRGLLEDWNRDYRRQRGLHHPKELLGSWLDYRLYPERGGRLREFLSVNCGLAPDVPTITFEGHWYPNPLAFALGTVPIPDHLRMRLISGRIHGDLHGQNILVGRPKSDDSDYYLIDLALYQPEQYLFFDHAYFEIAFLLSSRTDVDASDWASVLAPLSMRGKGERKGVSRAEDIGLVELIQALRQEVSGWIDRHERDRLSDMENQYLLARVAAGLNFTHKRTEEAKRRRAFIYAAASLKDYLKLNGIDWPKHGPPFSFDEDERPAAVAAAADSETSSSADRPAPAASTVVDAEPGEERHAAENQSLLANLMGELRRRHVVRVAGLYLVVAWLCVQITAMIKASLLLPVWTDTLVTVLLAIGFPIACIIAWAFELSPSGLQRTTPASPGNRPYTGNRSVLDYLVAGGIIFLVAVTVWRFDFGLSDTETSASADGSQLPSIAVLPFRDLSADGTDNNFSDGLTIEIMATLARGGKLRIAGQSSAFKYKSQSEDLRNIGQDLGVRYLLEGSVRRVGQDIRVEAQLIEADDGFLVWSDVFSDQIDDLFVIQEKIANAIGSALETPLGIKASGLESGRTNNPEAYELFLGALALSGQQGAGASAQIATGIELLKRSVEIDPDFAAGWAALSLAYDFGVVFRHEIDGRMLSPAVYIRRASEAAIKARELNPDLTIVKHAMANVHRRARQWTSSESSYRQALEKEPNNVLALMDYARLLAIVGYYDEAIAMTEQVGQIDPHNPLFGFTSSLYTLQTNPTSANFEKHLDGFGKEPDFAPFVLRSTMGYLFASGQADRLKTLLTDCTSCDASWSDRARSLIDAVGRDPPETIFNAYGNSRVLGYPLLDYLGGADLVLKSFEANTNDRSFNFQAFLVPWIEIEKVGRSETFRTLIGDLGFDEYWRNRGWPDHCKPLDDGSFECG